MRWCVAAGILLAGVVTACSDDNGDDATGDEGQPVATVRDTPIFEDDVATLAADEGFLGFIGAPVPGEDEDDLSQTEAGRRVLTWLIDRAVVDAELARQEVEVPDSAVEEATESLRNDELPESADVIVDEVEDMGREALEETATGLAAYGTLDQWLREIDPASPELHSQILTDHPEVADRVCGAAIAVDAAQAQAVRDHIAGGGTLDGLDPAVPSLSKTEPGGECMTRGAFPRQLVDLLYGTPLGSSGEQTVRSRTTGADVVFIVVPAVRDRLAGGDADAATQTTLQRLHDQGGAAFSELAFSTVDPALDTGWGRWDPAVGVVATDAPLPFTTGALPPPTTTTTIAPLPPPPPPPPPPPAAEPSQFVAATSPILAGQGGGDPGTADLTTRASAALNQGVSGAWRGAVPVKVSVISGSSSWSYTDGRLEVGSAHASGDWSRLEAIMAHEFGHHVAFGYGTQAELGAAPAGWPKSGNPAVERWADCVSQSFTGYLLGSHGQTPCEGASQSWATDWLVTGPNAHPRTG